MRYRRFVTVAVLFALLCLLTPTCAALAGTSVRMEGGVFAKGDVLWFAQADDTNAYGTYRGPMPWVVLDPDHAYDGTANRTTILSKYGCYRYMFDNMMTPHYTYRYSFIWQAMEVMATSRSFTSLGEYDLLVPITTTDAFPLNSDRYFILGEADFAAGGYLPTTASRMCYALTDPTQAVPYWVRKVYTGVPPRADYITVAGYFDTAWYSYIEFIRPVACLETGDIALYTVVGGKADGDGGLAANSTSLTGEFVLTAFDSTRTFTASGSAPLTTAGGIVSIPYADATVGANEYVSALITSGTADDQVLYYGRVLHTAAAADASGTVAVSIPAGLTAGGRYSLRLFSEQYNGGALGTSKLTDYASAFSTVALTVRAAPSVPDTGDRQAPFMWLGLAAVSALGLGLQWAIRHSRRRRA